MFDYHFTQRELFWLDHILPDEHRKKKEDEKMDKEAMLEEEVCFYLILFIEGEVSFLCELF